MSSTAKKPSILEQMYKVNGSAYGVLNKPSEEWSHGDMSTMLCWLNFFTIDRDNPGLFLGTFLLLKGWPEYRIGVVAFVKEIVSIFLQVPMGDLIDKTSRKREYLSAADFFIALTSFTFIFHYGYGWVVFCVMIQGAFLTIVPPALYGITLGMVGSRSLPEQSGENETYKHAGTAIRSLLIGIACYYGEDYWIFLFCIFSAAAAIFLVMKISPGMIDDKKARGWVPNKRGEAAKEPVAYKEFLYNRGVVVMLITVFFYHLGNAGMLPLLNQYLALTNTDSGLLITALNLAIAHLLIIPSAVLVGNKTDIWGTKNLFLIGLILNPIRGFMILGLINNGEDRTTMLIMTQIINGLSEGIYFVVIVVITERLTRGTGRFNFVYGMVNTSMATAGAFSNLIGNAIADFEGYSGGFVFLTIMAIVPILIYGLLMPPLPAVYPDTGETLSSHGTALGGMSPLGESYYAGARKSELAATNVDDEEEGEVVFREDIAVKAATPADAPTRQLAPPKVAPGEVANPMMLHQSEAVSL